MSRWHPFCLSTLARDDPSFFSPRQHGKVKYSRVRHDPRTYANTRECDGKGESNVARERERAYRGTNSVTKRILGRGKEVARKQEGGRGRNVGADKSVLPP